MHILLTDVLTCPRCGPAFGLILLADRIEDRRVIAGRLGCANCRTEYPIDSGVADLRSGATRSERSDDLAGEEGERGLRLAALSGLGDRPGSLLVSGASAELVSVVARLLPQAQVVGVSRSSPKAPPERTVSWILADGDLPVREGALAAAAAVAPEDVHELLIMGSRLAAGGHLVIDGIPPGGVEELSGEGWQILLEQDGVAVAARSPAG